MSTAVALFIRSFCIIVAIIVIMFTYSVVLTIFALLLIIPSIVSNRIFMTFTKKFNEQYQDAKSDLGAIAQETISNVRTVKAFANEQNSVAQYHKQNLVVKQLGKKKSIVWGLFMFGMKVF